MLKDRKSRAIVLAIVVVMGLLFLAPTIFKGMLPEQWISKPISLGLDLSGGAHLVYEVQTGEAVKNRLQAMANAVRADLRREKIPAIRAIVNPASQIEIVLLSALHLERAKAEIEDSYGELTYIGDSPGDREEVKLLYGIDEAQTDRIGRESIDRALETLRSRVDYYGVSEPLIQKTGENRIMLQMPGVTEVEEIQKLIGSVAQLEFRLVPAVGASSGVVTLRNREGDPVTVEDVALMTGEAVDNARVSVIDGKVEVSLSLTTDGARTFRRITSENVGRQLAIILDSVVYSSPVIREAIPGGQASISGGFTLEEARQLSIVLRAGALPAPLEIVEKRTVGPTLGRESIIKGVEAISIGFVLILIFMAIYYKKSGFVAMGTLALNVFLVMAGLSAFGATLTLPGLAGLALTVGMAVDANVIIFERIREELLNGSSRDSAVHAGFDKAFSAIIDSNLTTMLTGIILYNFGTGPIRGFAVTLTIGVLTTLFCATFVSRLAFDTFQLKSGKSLSI